MTESTFALVSFVLVATFTPGPNNLSSASLGMMYGYKKTLRYLMGISVGFLMVMFLCGWLSVSLRSSLPFVEVVLRWVGAAYILWLAWGMLGASYQFEDEGRPVFGFSKGFWLQLLNPKTLVFGMTLYATFLTFVDGHPLSLLVSAVCLAVVAFASTSSWALFGQFIRKYAQQPSVHRLVNAVLALLLVYTALQVSGVTKLL